MDELIEYARQHEDYVHSHSVETEMRCDVRLWGYEYNRDPDDRIYIDQDVMNHVKMVSKKVEKMTGFAPIVIPRLEAAMHDEIFLKSIAKEGCSFVAFDSPEGSLQMVQTYRIIFKVGTEVGVQRHYQKNNKQRLAKGRDNRHKKKNNFAEGLIEKLLYLENQGYKTYQAIADKLNEEKIPTPSGKGTWHINTVQRVKKNIISSAQTEKEK